MRRMGEADGTRMDRELAHALRRLCRSREIDVVLAPPPAPAKLALHGGFDGYGDFFLLAFDDVEYIDLAGGFTVGDLLWTSDFRVLSRFAPKWARLHQHYGGSALAFRSADAEWWEGADESTLFVVVAEDIHLRKGRDWRE